MPFALHENIGDRKRVVGGLWCERFVRKTVLVWLAPYIIRSDYCVFLISQGQAGHAGLVCRLVSTLCRTAYIKLFAPWPSHSTLSRGETIDRTPKEKKRLQDDNLTPSSPYSKIRQTHLCCLKYTFIQTSSTPAFRVQTHPPPPPKHYVPALDPRCSKTQASCSMNIAVVDVLQL